MKTFKNGDKAILKSTGRLYETGESYKATWSTKSFSKGQEIVGAQPINSKTGKAWNAVITRPVEDFQKA